MIIIDTNWLTMRQFHALGKPEDSTYLSMSVLTCTFKFLRDFGYHNRIALLWDGGTHRYRGSSDTYKGEREYDNSFQSCWDSMELTRQYASNMNMLNLRHKGVEADDIAYWMSKDTRFKDIDKTFITMDRDWFACVGDRSTVFRPITQKPEGEISTYESIMERYEVNSIEEFWYRKSLEGDSSDSIEKLTGRTKIMRYASLMDNLRTGGIDALPDEIIPKFKENMRLARMDHIMSDKEVTDSLHFDVDQHILAPSLSISNALPPSYPIHLNGSYNKYLDSIENIC